MWGQWSNYAEITKTQLYNGLYLTPPRVCRRRRSPATVVEFVGRVSESYRDDSHNLALSDIIFNVNKSGADSIYYIFCIFNIVPHFKLTALVKIVFYTVWIINVERTEVGYCGLNRYILFIHTAYIVKKQTIPLCIQSILFYNYKLYIIRIWILYSIRNIFQ